MVAGGVEVIKKTISVMGILIGIAISTYLHMNSGYVKDLPYVTHRLFLSEFQKARVDIFRSTELVAGHSGYVNVSFAHMQWVLSGGSVRYGMHGANAFLSIAKSDCWTDFELNSLGEVSYSRQPGCNPFSHEMAISQLREGLQGLNLFHRTHEPQSIPMGRQVVARELTP